MNPLSVPFFAGAASALLCLDALVAQDPPAPAPAANGIPECKEMTTTDSGLQIGFLKKGRDEAPPKRDDTVEVHYTGWLLDGTKFDSSRDRGEPTRFGVGDVIAGWTEGLQKMTPGARCKLVIPGDLAYGPNGRPPKIGPNATLVFDVELLKVLRMPVLPPSKPEAQKALPSGVKVEVVREGSGAAVGATDGVALRFAYWRPTGELLDCSERQNDLLLKGAAQGLPLAFLSEAVAGAKKGTVLRIEVPVEQFPNARMPTVWQLEIAEVLPGVVPAFRLPEREKTVTTQSGLQYEVLELGQGDSPAATDTVSALYTGWLEDGTLFDSGHGRGEPTSFGLNRVIKGWTEGLQLMKPGGKFLFRIPAALGYGKNGSPPKIPADATLVFLVELVDVKKR